MHKGEPTAREIAEGKLYETMGLSEEEYAKVCHALGREPNYVETGIFSVMWSEHCSYKNSKRVLRLFPTTGARVLQGPGEGAGIVDIGDGQAVVFKIESHNHPSAVAPFDGAATGVGGIVRDVFSMGARPVALLNSLRFGPLSDERVRELLTEAIKGMAAYGRGIDVSTVGGEVLFDEAYRGNPLVNAMCVGVLEHKHIQQGVAAGVGNPVIYLGPSTGRDGIHGATFASEELADDTDAEQPVVPKGDPFMEKRVMEACLELIAQGIVEGIQDMGAAGLTSSSAEMAAKAGNGIELDLDQVPQRENDMSAYELMLSESQERMLIVVAAGREDDVRAVADKWGVPMAVVGRVTDDECLRLRHRGKEVCDVPVRALVDEAPEYTRAAREPDDYAQNGVREAGATLQTDDVGAALRQVLQSPNAASKRVVYEQFVASVAGASPVENSCGCADTDVAYRGNGAEVCDQAPTDSVHADVVVGPGANAGVVQITGTKKALAMTTDGNGRYVYLDPYTGGAIAVAEAARNVVCSGAEPLAVTDNLNYGNPEKPDIYWQLEQSVRGISDACRSLETPVVSGNVSLYNETGGKAIYPTPVIGMVGLIDDVAHTTTHAFKQAGDVLVLLGETYAELGGSVWQHVREGEPSGRPPRLDLARERAVQQATLAMIRAGHVQAAHDLSEGGLAVALCEACFAGGYGADVILQTELSATDVLFSESQSRVLLAVNEAQLDDVQKIAKVHGASCAVIGKVTVAGTPLQIAVNDNVVVREDVSELKHVWEGTLACQLSRSSTN
ncbi:phosphoribosylformylglycinamidine synthase subunit PurL [Numidum massiliense]|uniref:phosphoribosylformylglycinamidine synthase subunit PurL n=1 Tax=Numidum massiliense TaxID=1522315 RepID=UPI0006D5A5CB|nr:phosphoribosylformylglycinamidine synthase subunit PurL [Numidum massiliense]